MSLCNMPARCQDWELPAPGSISAPIRENRAFNLLDLSFKPLVISVRISSIYANSAACISPAFIITGREVRVPRRRLAKLHPVLEIYPYRDGFDSGFEAFPPKQRFAIRPLDQVTNFLLSPPRTRTRNMLPDWLSFLVISLRTDKIQWVSSVSPHDPYCFIRGVLCYSDRATPLLRNP